MAKSHHIEHLDLLSEINFLKKEMEFLLIILQKEYSLSLTDEKIKLWDTYWLEFEKNIDDMNTLVETIQKGEKKIFREDILTNKFYTIYREVQTLKGNFYNSVSLTMKLRERLIKDF